MNKYLAKSLAVLMPFFLILIISGVFAEWNYAGLPAADAQYELSFRMNTFTYWEGAEILPNEEGESHITLINNLVNGSDSRGNVVGLNNPNSAVSQNLENRLNGGPFGIFTKTDYYGSMDGTILDNNIDMEGVFNTDTLGLDFIIQAENDLTYYIYTTSVDIGISGAPNIPLGEEIFPIYRSTIVRENTSSDFVIKSTEIGHATSVYYKQLSSSAWLHDQTVPSFNVESWKSCVYEPIGTSLDNAIWTFVGDTPSASLDDPDSVVYFKLDDAGERKISTSNAYAKIKVLDSAGNTVAQSEFVTNNYLTTVELNFTIEESSVYYLEFTGSTYIQFTVE